MTDIPSAASAAITSAAPARRFEGNSRTCGAVGAVDLSALPLQPDIGSLTLYHNNSSVLLPESP